MKDDMFWLVLGAVLIGMAIGSSTVLITLFVGGTL